MTVCVIFCSVISVYTLQYPFNSERMLHILVLGYLTISGYVDMKTSKIPMLYSFTFLPILCYRWVFTLGTMASYLDLFVIVILCLSGKLVNKIIGIGDIYIFAVLTLIYGLKTSVTIFCIAMTFIGLYALFCQSIKGILLQKKARVVLSPFIGVSYMVYMFLGNR